MRRRLRCRLGLHKWVLKQDSREAPKFYGCLYCDKMQDLDNWPVVDLGGGVS